MPKIPRRGNKVKPTSKDFRNKLGKPPAEIEGETEKPTKKRLTRKQRTKLKIAAEEKAERTGTVITNPKANSSPPKKTRSDLLLNPATAEEDIKLVQQSISKGWNVRGKRKIVRRLMSILDKTTGDMSTKDGIVASETVADNLAIQASKVLVAMNGQDVTMLEKNKPTTPTTVIQNNVTNNVLNQSGSFDARTIELARLAHKFGAREFSVNGRQIPIHDIIGESTSLSIQEDSVVDTSKTPPDSAS